MKFVHASASLALLSSLFLSAPTGSAALKCGIAGVTKQCIGKTDVRYDPDTSYDLADQDEYWGDLSGLYYGAQNTHASPDWSLLSERAFDELPGLTFDFSAARKFINFTVDGTRFHYKTVTMANCSSPGFPGMVLPSESYCKCFELV